jgi:hypothetical protein
MANDPATTLSPNQERKEKRYPIGVIGGICFLAMVVVALLLLSGKNARPPGQAASPNPSDAASGYAPQVAFSDLRLSAEENFIGQQVVYLDGKVTNTGTKTVRQLKVRLVFRDVMNQIVLREEHDVFGSSDSVGPGLAKSFQIRFDAVPDSWSRQVPQIQIVSLRAEQP